MAIDTEQMGTQIAGADYVATNVLPTLPNNQEYNSLKVTISQNLDMARNHMLIINLHESATPGDAPRAGASPKQTAFEAANYISKMLANVVANIDQLINELQNEKKAAAQEIKNLVMKTLPLMRSLLNAINKTAGKSKVDVILKNATTFHISALKR